MPTVGQAGGVLLTATVRASGLDAAMQVALSPWRKPLAVHDPGKVVTDLALTLAVGGDGLADIALLRAEPGVYGRVASDPTVSRTIDALAADAPAALAAINTARATARTAVWELAGEHAPDSCADAAAPLVIDIDATLVTSYSEKEQAAACVICSWCTAGDRPVFPPATPVSCPGPLFRFPDSPRLCRSPDIATLSPDLIEGRIRSAS